MSPKIILYGVDMSPPVRACWMTLKALEIPFDFVELEVAAGELQSPEYLKKNPQGTMPLLEDDGHFIWDSHAICSYLVDKYGKSDALYPKDLLKRAHVNQRLFFDGCNLFVSLYNISAAFFQRGEKEVPKLKIEAVQKALALTETYLGDAPYICGDSLTIADLCCAATVTSLPAFVDINAEKYPKIVEWLARLAELPYFDEVNAEGTKKYIELMKSNLIFSEN